MGRMSPLFAPLSAQPSPPCIDDYTTAWINQEAVYQVSASARVPVCCCVTLAPRLCTLRSRILGPDAATSFPILTPTFSLQCSPCQFLSAVACAPSHACRSYTTLLTKNISMLVYR
jgi:hypothetical protein